MKASLGQLAFLLVCGLSVSVTTFADDVIPPPPTVDQFAQAPAPEPVSALAPETAVAPAAEIPAVATPATESTGQPQVVTSTPAETVEAPVTIATVVATPVACAPDLTGYWCGSWQSCTNGHHGPMNATFCRTCDGNDQVTFIGKFCKVIPFRYTTTLNVTCQKDGVTYMSGSQFLGPLLGSFSYNAWANDR